MSAAVYVPPFASLGVTPVEFEFLTMGDPWHPHRLAAYFRSRNLARAHLASYVDGWDASRDAGGSAAVECANCGGGFTVEEWEERCWRDGDGADVHRDCCVRCKREGDHDG